MNRPFLLIPSILLSSDFHMSTEMSAASIIIILLMQSVLYLWLLLILFFLCLRFSTFLWCCAFVGFSLCSAQDFYRFSHCGLLVLVSFGKFSPNLSSDPSSPLLLRQLLTHNFFPFRCLMSVILLFWLVLIIYCCQQITLKLNSLETTNICYLTVSVGQEPRSKQVGDSGSDLF